MTGSAVYLNHLFIVKVTSADWWDEVKNVNAMKYFVHLCKLTAMLNANVQMLLAADYCHFTETTRGNRQTSETMHDSRQTSGQ